MRATLAIALALTGMAITGLIAAALVTSSTLLTPDPESLFSAAGLAVSGLTLAWSGFITARRVSSVVRGVVVALVISTMLSSAIVLWPALLVAGEPFYLENRQVTVDVRWKVHDHFQNRIVFNVTGDRYWHTLREQSGLKEHL